MKVERRDGRPGVPDGFCELAAQVYAEDGQWIPEDPAAIATAFSEDNSWFQSGAAQTFLIPGKARAAAFANRLPASAAVHSPQLVRPGLLVEIEAIAVLGAE